MLRLAHEHEIVGVDLLPASTAVRCLGDVADPRVLAAAFDGAQAAIHVAALHAPHVGNVPDAEFERVNVKGTEEIVRAARRSGVRRIVFASTTALYGSASVAPGRAAWIDEDVEPRPLTVYHRTKLAAEELLRQEADSRLDIRILRIARCFPEPADVMGVYRLHRGIDARDVAAAHASALLHCGGPHHTWVISGATPFRPADSQTLAEDAPSVLRARAPDLVKAYERRGWSVPATIDRVYDSRRAMSDLGWQPRYGFAEVLAMLDAENPEVLPPLRAMRQAGRPDDASQ
jgi:nucleoside-diphosphate-sugar epimerase